MVKGFNDAWRNSGRKESEISIRYQYKSFPQRGKVASADLPRGGCRMRENQIPAAFPKKAIYESGAYLATPRTIFFSSCSSSIFCLERG